MKIYIIFDRAGFVVAVFTDKEKLLASDAIKGAEHAQDGQGIDGCFWEEHEVAE